MYRTTTARDRIVGQIGLCCLGILALLALLALGSCAIAPALRSPDEVAIRSARSIQTKALAINDLDRVQSFWTPDVTIRRALGQSLSGSDAARKVLEPTGSSQPVVVYQRETTSVEVSPHWPLAYEEGRWSGYLGTVGASPIISGRYSAQWVKRNGQWLIRSEVFVALNCAAAGCTYPALP